MRCYAPDCDHCTETHDCSFFKAPKDEEKLKKWDKTLRRQDNPLTEKCRVCSCHFKDRKRSNGPEIFKRNKHLSQLTLPSPKKASPLNKRRKIVPPETTANQEEACRDVPQDDLCAELHKKILELELEKRKLQEKLITVEASTTKKLTYNDVKCKPEVLNHYTGLDDHKFCSLLSLFQKISLNYYYGWNVTSLTKDDQLLLLLMKLHNNYGYVDLAFRFEISKATVGNIFLTWMHALHEILYKQLYLSAGIPSRFKNQKSLPESFKDLKNCRIVLDCTEIKVQVSKELDKQKDTYSSYKSTNTFKSLVGVAPNGTITYTSKLYTGSRSDKEIVYDCKILDQMVPGDLILADKGFLISDLLPPSVTLNIPPFLNTPQFTLEQARTGEKIAKARVHVERAIKRVKEFQILNIIPSAFQEFSSKIWQVCIALTGFNDPLISEVGDTFC